MAFVFHGALYALAVGLGLFQPAIRAATSARPAALAQRMLELFSAFGRPQLLLLGVAFLLVIGLGLGTNVTFPVYFPVVHGLSAGEASNMVASATLIMVAGSAFAGFVLPHVRSSSLFVILAALGFATGALCFYPDMSVGARMVVLAGWYLMAGAALSTVHACLPLVADPARPGAAAALLNFAGALAAFINPPLWLGVFATGQWQPFLILLAVGWAVAVLALLAAIHVAGVRGRGGVTAPGPAG
jgi:hypothetical protein